MPPFQDLKGLQFGSLRAIECLGNDESGHILWRCQCECGNEVIKRSKKVKTANSCGCKRNEFLKSGMAHRIHGGSGTRLHKIWKGVLYRCSNKNDPDYGGRGIQVCGEWRNDFTTFRDWSLKNGYSEDLTIDRIDNNGHYEPEDCRWATQIQQVNNTQQNHWLTLFGETHTIAQWSRKTGISVSAIKHRLERGWPMQDVLTVPLRGVRSAKAVST